jgi:hypothetical protein
MYFFICNCLLIISGGVVVKRSPLISRSTVQYIHKHDHIKNILQKYKSIIMSTKAGAHKLIKPQRSGNETPQLFVK